MNADSCVIVTSSETAASALSPFFGLFLQRTAAQDEYCCIYCKYRCSRGSQPVRDAKVYTAAGRTLAGWAYSVEEEEAETRCQEIESVRSALHEKRSKRRQHADDSLPIDRKAAEHQKEV